MKKLIIIILLTYTAQSSLYSQSTNKFYDDFSDRYFTHLYNFEFNDVKSMLDSIDSKHKLENHLFKANYYFWRTISGDTTLNYFKLCKQELNEQIDLNKKSKLTKTENIFLNSLTYSFLMRLELHQNNYLNGIKILDKSISYFEKALDNKDNLEEFYFLSGFYNYFMAYTYEEYPIFNVYLKLYKSGNKTLGIKQLKKSTESDNMIIKTEAIYFLMKIYTNTEKDYKTAKYYSDLLLKLYPNNINFHAENYILLSKLSLHSEIKMEKEKILFLLKNNTQLNDAQKLYFQKKLK